MLSEMFSDARDGAERAQRFEQYKAALQQAIDDADSGRYTFAKSSATGVTKMRPAGSATKSVEALLERVQDIQKGLTADAAASLQNDLDTAKAMIADIAKDWQVGLDGISANPAGQPVPYDLQQPIKEIVPLHTPLRNDTVRNQMGEGLATHWKQLDSLNNAGVGTAGVLSPFFSSQTDPGPTFGSLQLRRGKKISYVTSDHTAAYVELGYSDLVTSVAQYAGAGFANVRQLSRHALTWTHLMGEERAILYGRGGTGNGYLGAVSAPVISAADSGQSGSLSAAAYKIIVTANAGFGQSVQSNEVTVTPTASHGITVTVTTEPVGALNYNLYVTAAAGASGSETLQATFVGNTITFTTVTAGAALPANTDTTADSNGFDGWLSVLPSQGGYVKRINNKLSTSSIGSEFQTAFQAMYQNNFAEPGEIWCDSNVKVELGQLLQNNAQNLPFRIQMTESNGSIGTAVTGIQNQLNDQMVGLQVHPFMPLGCVMLRSTHLPYPAQGISATSEMRMVQDYMAIDWPQIQHTWDSSTYAFGTLIHYAPAFSGILLGVQ